MAAHDGAFNQVFRLAAGVSPGIEEDGNPLFRRDRRRNARAFNPLDAAQFEKAAVTAAPVLPAATTASHAPFLPSVQQRRWMSFFCGEWPELDARPFR